MMVHWPGVCVVIVGGGVQLRWCGCTSLVACDTAVSSWADVGVCRRAYGALVFPVHMHGCNVLAGEWSIPEGVRRCPCHGLSMFVRDSLLTPV